MDTHLLSQDVIGAVIVAGGRGERFGNAGKAVVPLLGRPMLSYSLDVAERSASVRDVVIVTGEHIRATVERLVAGGAWRKVGAIVTGGARRQDSVAAGIRALREDITVVAVHDAARPLVTVDLLDRCIKAACDDGAAIAAVPVADTLKRVVAGRIAATVERDGLWAAQTPQVMRRAILLDAMGPDVMTRCAVTDEAAWCESIGVPVTIVPSSPANLKVTQAADITVAEALLRIRQRDSQSDCHPG